MSSANARKRRLFLGAVGLLSFSGSSPANFQGPEGDTSRPRFGEYPVDPVYALKTHRIVWSRNLNSGEPKDKKFADAVSRSVSHGPNFAGRYSIARWGLGTGLSSMAVVDLATGKVFDEMPFVFLDVPWDPDDKVPYRGFSFRSNSALLIASGCFYRGKNQTGPDCGWKYYKWENDRFVLAREVSGPIRPKYHWHPRK